MNSLKIHKAAQSRRRQRGIAALELMIVTPVVLFMIMAVAELGYAMRQYNTLTQSVRNAARYIAEEGVNEAGINLTATKITATQNLAAYGSIAAGSPILPGLSPGSVTVAAISADELSVTATYPYQPIFVPSLPQIVNGVNAGGSFNMRAQVVMRRLK